MGIATLLEMEQNDPETVSYCAINLKAAISRLDEVILDLSKILDATNSSVEIIPERIDFAETIRNVEIDLSDKISRNNAKIILSPGMFVTHSHRAYIYSIFFNLISNAIKYRSESSPVITVDFIQRLKVRGSVCF